MNTHEFLVNSASGRLLRALDARDERDADYRAEKDPSRSLLYREQASFWNQTAAGASRDLERYLDYSESEIPEIQQAIVEAEDNDDNELAQELKDLLAELERELDPAEL